MSKNNKKTLSEILTCYVTLTDRDGQSDIERWDKVILEIRKRFPEMTKVAIEKSLNDMGIQNPYLQ